MPFSYDKACEIAEDFTDLEGTGISVETPDGDVYCIVNSVAPAVITEGSDDYDVLITGTNTDNNSQIIIRIEEYIKTMGIRYNFL